MAFAVFLQRAEAPETARVVDGLAGCGLGDVHQLRRSATAAHGVLFEGLTEARAEQVVARLADVGIEAAAGAEQWLALPEARRARSFSWDDAQLVLRDAGGSEVRLRPDDIVLLAAGQLAGPTWPTPDVAAPAAAVLSTPVGFGSAPAAVASALAGGASHERLPTSMADLQPSADGGLSGRLVLDVFTREPPARHRVRADQFHYGGLRGPLGAGSRENFARLLAELAAFAPAAAQTSGASGMLAGESPPSYPDEAAFERESSQHLYWAHGGDLARYPLTGAPKPAGLPPEAAAALAMLQPRPRPQRRTRARGLWLAIQLVVIALLLGVFWQVFQRLMFPAIE